MDKMTVYGRLPVFAQNWACSLEGMRIERSRYDKVFWDKLREYESLAQKSFDERCAYRDAQLSKMAIHCYRTVPHWRRVFDDAGLNPASVRTLDDLQKIPVLTKEEVKANPEGFLSSDFMEKKLISQHTSGTTGGGFVFYTTSEALSAQWAIWWRYRRSLGISYGDDCAVFGGRTVVPIACRRAPYYRVNRPSRQFLFSQYHLGGSTADEYIAELRKLRVKWLHGYPSALALLAHFLLDRGESLEVDHVTLGAENLLESQESALKEAFHVSPRQHYGLSEAVANFSQDTGGDMYVDEEFAAVEFVENEYGATEVVGTTLTNYAMPLLRYQTHDTAEVEQTTFGRKVVALDGRLEDYVVLSDGSRVGRLDHLFKDLVNVVEAQIVQDRPGAFVVTLVPNRDYSESDTLLLDKEIRDRMGDVEYAVEFVKAIPRTASGKLRLVVSRMDEGTLR